MAVGFDNLAFNHNLLLSLPFDEENGAAAVYNDRSKQRHQFLAGSAIVTSTPAASDLPVIDFGQAVPDFLECSNANTADLRFTTEDFSLASWIRIESFTGDCMIMCRGLAVTDGWQFYVELTGRLHIVTSQVAVDQDTYSAAASIALATWYFVVATRDDADCLVYINAVSSVDVAGAHVNPVAAPRKTLVGIYDDEAASPFDGLMWNPRIWDIVLSEANIMNMFQVERHWFGV